MADTPANVSMWMTLVPVVVGGAIGLAGGWFGPWFIERRKEAAEKRKILAGKFEQLVSALFEYEHWMNIVTDMELLTRPTELVPSLPPSPSAKLHAISAIHFPEFEDKILKLEDAGNTYRLWLIESRRKLISGEKDYTAGHNKAYEAFFSESRTLLAELRNYAKRKIL